MPDVPARLPKEDGAYHGVLGKTLYVQVHVSQVSGVAVTTSVVTQLNSETDPQLGELALDGALHSSLRGHALAIPYIFHDPRMRRFCLVLPESLRHRELAEKAALCQRLAAETAHSLPAYVRRADVVIGHDGLRHYLDGPGGEARIRLDDLRQREHALLVATADLAKREARLQRRAEDLTLREDELHRRFTAFESGRSTTAMEAHAHQGETEPAALPAAYALEDEVEELVDDADVEALDDDAPLQPRTHDDLPELTHHATEALPEAANAEVSSATGNQDVAARQKKRSRRKNREVDNGDAQPASLPAAPEDFAEVLSLVKAGDPAALEQVLEKLPTLSAPTLEALAPHLLERAADGIAVWEKGLDAKRPAVCRVAIALLGTSGSPAARAPLAAFVEVDGTGLWKEAARALATQGEASLNAMVRHLSTSPRATQRSAERFGYAMALLASKGLETPIRQLASNSNSIVALAALEAIRLGSESGLAGAGGSSKDPASPEAQLYELLAAAQPSSEPC